MGKNTLILFAALGEKASIASSRYARGVMMMRTLLLHDAGARGHSFVMTIILIS